MMRLYLTQQLLKNILRTHICWFLFTITFRCLPTFVSVRRTDMQSRKKKRKGEKNRESQKGKEEKEKIGLYINIVCQTMNMTSKYKYDINSICFQIPLSNQCLMKESVEEAFPLEDGRFEIRLAVDRRRLESMITGLFTYD